MTAFNDVTLIAPIKELTRSELIDAFIPLKKLLVMELISDELTFSLRTFRVLTVRVLILPFAALRVPENVPEVARIVLVIKVPA